MQFESWVLKIWKPFVTQNRVLAVLLMRNIINSQMAVQGNFGAQIKELEKQNDFFYPNFLFDVCVHSNIHPKWTTTSWPIYCLDMTLEWDEQTEWYNEDSITMAPYQDSSSFLNDSTE